MNVIAWLICVAVCALTLFRSSRYRARVVLTSAIVAIIGGMLLVVILGLVLREMQVRLSHSFLTVLFQALMSIVTIAMLNIMNLAVRGMIAAQTSFHTRYNAANLRRFPVSFVIDQADRIRLIGTIFWSSASLVMFYGIWFHMTV